MTGGSGEGHRGFEFPSLISPREASRDSKMPPESLSNELRDSGTRGNCNFSFVLSDNINCMLVP